MSIFNACNPILAVIPEMRHRESIPIAVIPDIFYRVSIPIPMGVIPDIFNRASILVFFGWIPAYNRGYDGKKVGYPPQTAGMTEGEMDTFTGC